MIYLVAGPELFDRVELSVGRCSRFAGPCATDPVEAVRRRTELRATSVGIEAV